VTHEGLNGFTDPFVGEEKEEKKNEKAISLDSFLVKEEKKVLVSKLETEE